MERVSELAARRLREAVETGLLPGRIEADGTIVIEVEAPPPATRRSPR
jgi:hypothetical protein